MTGPHLPIAIVGAGFGGTIAALHLLDRLPSRTLLSCERSPAFGRGAAYATSSPVHLLNVRAANGTVNLGRGMAGKAKQLFAGWPTDGSIVRC
jgi:uncharacterized NAD(P)/FAD-binding protein YdhS